MLSEGRKRFAVGLLVGVVLTLVCLGAVVFFLISRSPSVGDSYKEQVQKESLGEQARLGIERRNMDIELQTYLTSKSVDALSQQYKDPAAWKQSVTKSVVEETTRTAELVRDCYLLFNRGDKGKLNGLDHLRFATEDVYRDLNLINSMLKYQPLDRCNDVCLRNTMSAVQGAILSLRKQVR